MYVLIRRTLPIKIGITETYMVIYSFTLMNNLFLITAAGCHPFPSQLLPRSSSSPQLELTTTCLTTTTSDIFIPFLNCYQNQNHLKIIKELSSILLSLSSPSLVRLQLNSSSCHQSININTIIIISTALMMQIQ